MRFFQRQAKRSQPNEQLDAMPDPFEKLGGAGRPTEMPLELHQQPLAPQPQNPNAQPMQTAISRPVSIGVADPVDAKPRRRVNAGKTRLIGFDTSDGRLDIFSEEKKKSSKSRHFKPIGWIVVVDGPGCGNSFALSGGLSTIGRGEDQTVALAFGDTAISRDNHAAVAYEAETGAFLLGHGGKANLVRLNGKPLVSTEQIENGAEIQIGETTLRFVAFCDAEFNWNKLSKKDEADVAFI
ncbi:MAG: FHA domain-containing protein [Pseudomonadota bacterium]